MASALAKLRWQSAQAAGLRVASLLLAFVMHIFLGRLLKAAEYGVFCYALALTGAFAAITPLGLPTAAARFVADYHQAERWGLLRGLLVRCRELVWGTALAAAALLALISFIPGLSPLAVTGLRFSALLLPFWSFVTLRQRIFLGLQQVALGPLTQDCLLPAAMVLATLPALATIRLPILGQVWRSITEWAACLPAMHHSTTALWTYFGATALVFVVGTLALHLVVPAAAHRAVPEYRTREWLRVSFPILIGTSLQTALRRLDIVILSFVLPPAGLGLYSAASRLAQVNTFLPGAVSEGAIGLFASAWSGGRPQEFRALLNRTLLWSALCSLPLFLIMFFLPAWALGLYSEEFRPAATVLQVLAVGYFIGAATMPVRSALPLSGREKLFAWISGGGAVLNLAAVVVGAVIAGMLGAAVASTAAFGATSLGLTLGAYLQPLPPPADAASPSPEPEAQ